VSAKSNKQIVSVIEMILFIGFLPILSFAILANLSIKTKTIEASASTIKKE
jgi:hypothetical protein